MTTATVPPSLYVGRVGHLRRRPRHRFGYRVFMLWLDLAAPEGGLAGLRLAGWDRRAPLVVRARDHGPRDGSALWPWAQARLAEAGLAPAARLFLLTMPRVWGYAFNPLSVYYCFDAAGGLHALIYEVRNTFGDWHWYVLGAGAAPGEAARHGCAKRFHVSPFQPMAGSYRFRAAPPGDRLALAIDYRIAGRDGLVATLALKRRALADRALAALLLRRPWVTAKVKAAIYWQALKLAAKRAPFHRRPVPGPAVTPAPAADGDLGEEAP